MGETIIDLKLEKCCYDVIDEINRKIKSAKIAAAALGAYSVFQIFFSPGSATKAAARVSTIYNVTNADWQQFSNAVTALGIFTRREAANEAAWHANDHSRDNNRKCELFWRGVYEHFL